MNCYNEFDKKFMHGSSFTTTYEIDFKKYCKKDVNIKKEKLYNEVEDITPKPQKYRDMESLDLYQDDCYVPFNLFHYPRPIIHKRHIPTTKELQKNLDYDIIKSRPKLYISPALPIDNIEDHSKRDTVIKYMYTTEKQISQQFSALPTAAKPIHVDLNRPTYKDNVYLKTELYEPLVENTVKKSIPWDDAQNRWKVDPTEKFWLHNDHRINYNIDRILPLDKKHEIFKLIKEDNLRAEHDLRCSTYGGYIPNCTDSIPLDKTEFPISYPFISVYQTLDLRKTDKEGHKLYHTCDKNK